MPSNPSIPDPRSARARILRAAMLLFARTPYSETSLREIAAEAQVDVAYVHRTYGSKAEIFRQALHAVAPLEGMFSPPCDAESLIGRICDRAFLRDPQRPEDVEPLHLIMQSCACSEARNMVDDFIATAIVRPLADALGHEDTGRATFAISLLTGFITMRLVIGNAALQAIPEDRLKPMLARALRDALTP